MESPFRLSEPPEGNRYTGCKYHSHHDRQTVELTVSGRLNNSVPTVLPQFERHLTAMVYDYKQYGNDGYTGGPWPHDACTGQDVVSFCIAEQRIWEPFETILWSDILTQGDRSSLVVDLGCQIGWYSLLSTSYGYHVLAVDSEPENLELAKRNTEWNGGVGRAIFQRGWFDDQVPRAEFDTHIRAVKIDIEGYEAAAVEALSGAFADHIIDYALIEFSPVFNDSYPALAQRLIDWGYQGFAVPQRRWDRMDEFSRHPLETLISTEPVTSEMVATWRQENVVFLPRA